MKERTGQQGILSRKYLIQAGLVSVLLIIAITRIVQENAFENSLIEKENVTIICQLEACNMV